MSLESSYRRLLFAYPRSYRERRGEEIIATLMDDAQPDQQRPDLWATLDLLAGGLRERLGLHKPDGFAAGATLVAPACITLAVLGAITSMVAQPAAIDAAVVALIWLTALVVWALAPRWRGLAAGVALVVTLVGLWSGPQELWSVACWGFLTLAGSLSVRARSAYRSRVVRIGLLVAVVLLGALTLWWPAPVPLTDGQPSLGVSVTWYGLVSDLVVFGAVVGGMIAAGIRRSVWATWAAFAMLITWAAAGGVMNSYLMAYNVHLGLSALIPIKVILVVAAVLLIVALIVAQRQVGGPGLHRAGGVALGYAGGLTAMAVVELVQGADHSYWGGGPLVWSDVGPLWITLVGLIALPALTDRWVPAPVQRGVLVLAISSAVAAAVLVPAHIGPIPLLVCLLVLGLVTRAAGLCDTGGLAGLAVGIGLVLLTTLVEAGSPNVLPIAMLGLVLWLYVLAGLAVAPVIALVAHRRTWLGATAFAAAAVVLVMMFGPALVPLALVAVLLGISAHGLARYWPARPRPTAPAEESA